MQVKQLEKSLQVAHFVSQSMHCPYGLAYLPATQRIHLAASEQVKQELVSVLQIVQLPVESKADVLVK